MEVKLLWSLSPFPFLSSPLLVTGDQAGGTLVNQASPATASFGSVSVVQLRRDTAIKRQRDKGRDEGWSIK